MRFLKARSEGSFEGLRRRNLTLLLIHHISLCRECQHRCIRVRRGGREHARGMTLDHGWRREEGVDEFITMHRQTLFPLFPLVGMTHSSSVDVFLPQIFRQEIIFGALVDIDKHDVWLSHRAGIMISRRFVGYYSEVKHTIRNDSGLHLCVWKMGCCNS